MVTVAVESHVAKPSALSDKRYSKVTISGPGAGTSSGALYVNEPS